MPEKDEIPLTPEKQELMDLYKQKVELQKCLMDLEKQIYGFEEGYLNDTRDFGNVVIGWENAESNRNRNKVDKKHTAKRIRNSERIFSMSSVTSFDVNPSLREKDTDDENQNDENPKKKKKKAA